MTMQAARGLFLKDNWGYAQLMRNRRFTTLIITTISSSFPHLSYFFFALSLRDSLFASANHSFSQLSTRAYLTA
jgi:hypothetical protein